MGVFLRLNDREAYIQRNLWFENVLPHARENVKEIIGKPMKLDGTNVGSITHAWINDRNEIMISFYVNFEYISKKNHALCASYRVQVNRETNINTVHCEGCEIVNSDELAGEIKCLTTKSSTLHIMNFILCREIDMSQ